MKAFAFLLLAGLSYATAASAQTTPTQSTSPTQAPRGNTTASPSAVPSGTAPMPSNPRGAVSAGEVFTTGAPNSSSSSHSKMKKNKGSMSSDGSGKMKSKM